MAAPHDLVPVSPDELSSVPGFATIRKHSDKFPKRAVSAAELRSRQQRFIKSAPPPTVTQPRPKRVEAVRLTTAQLTKLGDLLQSCETSEEAYSVITQAAGPLYAGDSGVLYELSGSRTVVEQVAAWGENSSSLSVFAPSECWALRRGRPYLVEDHTHLNQRGHQLVADSLIALGLSPLSATLR